MDEKGIRTMLRRAFRPVLFFFLLLFALSVSVADPVGPFLNHVELTLNGAYGNTTFSDYVIILQKDVPYELPGDIRSIRFYFLGGPTRDPTIIQVGIYDGFKFLDRFDFRGIRQNDPRSFPAISSSLFNQRSNSSLTIALRTGVVGPVRQVSGTVSVEPNPPVREYYSLAINDQVIGDYRITLNAIVSSADSTRIRFNSIRNNMGVFEQRPSVQDHCVLYLRSVNLHSFPTFYHSDLHFVDDVHHGTMRSNYHDGRSIPFTLRRHVLAAGELEPIYGLRMSTRIQDTVTGEDIYRLDIDLDVEGLIEEKEENPGGLLLIGETLSISLNISESLIAARGRLTVKLDSGADRVLLSVPGRSEPAFTSRTWKLGTDAVPTRLTVKGVRPSTNPRDVSIQLIYRSPDGNYSYDQINLTVPEADLDIVHPVTGLMPEQDEKRRGGYVAKYRDQWTPVTKLRLQKMIASIPDGYFKLLWKSPNIRLWKDKTLKTEVLSNKTRFRPDETTDLYIQGLSESKSLKDIKIELVLMNGEERFALHNVELTIVRAEFDVAMKIFIPYDWVKIPHDTDEVAKGDGRTFDPRNFGNFKSDYPADVPEKANYRVKQVATIIPYKDLSSSHFLTRKEDGKVVQVAENLVGVTKHYYWPSSLTKASAFRRGVWGLILGDLPAHSGLQTKRTGPGYLSAMALADEHIGKKGGSYLSAMGKTDDMNMKKRTMKMFVDGEKRTDTRTFVRFHGSATNPLIRIAAAIDWNFLLGIDIKNPLRPRYLLSGKHDGFPAYEIYMKTVKDGRPKLKQITTLYQWKPPVKRSVEALINRNIPFILPSLSEKIKRKGNIR